MPSKRPSPGLTWDIRLPSPDLINRHTRQNKPSPVPCVCLSRANKCPPHSCKHPLSEAGKRNFTRKYCTTISISLSKCWFMACFVLHAMLCDALRRSDQAIKDPVKCHYRWMNLVIIHMNTSVFFSTIACYSPDQKSGLADWLLGFLLVPRHHRLVLW